MGCCCSSEEKLEEPNWEQNKVYLYQFPRSKIMPNLSPYCLKLETFLRVFKIDYEVREKTKSKHLMPYIELNGKIFRDSQIIEERLKEHFHVQTELSPRDEALSRAICRMIDHHTFILCIKYKGIDRIDDFADTVIDDLGIPLFLSCLAHPIIAMIFKRRMNTRIKGCTFDFSDEEFARLLDRDLSAIENIKGENKYLFGDTITYADITVFGHLASVYYLPTENRVKTQIETKYKSIATYLNNIRYQVYPNDFVRDK